MYAGGRNAVEKCTGSFEKLTERRMGDWSLKRIRLKCSESCTQEKKRSVEKCLLFGFFGMHLCGMQKYMWSTFIEGVQYY